MSPNPSRVEIHPLTSADREAFVTAMAASRALHRRWAAPPTTAGTFDALLERKRCDGAEFMLVRRREDDEIVGYFDISQIVRGPLQSAFLGYAGVAAHSRSGYMSEGIELVLRRAFTDLRLHRLEANIQPGNEASLALARSAGFVREGISERYLKVGGRWRDHERWAIRVEQWRERNRRR